MTRSTAPFVEERRNRERTARLLNPFRMIVHDRRLRME